MYVVELQEITKAFAGVKANDRVTVRVRKGDIHALVGENGAGKSTLMKILYGMVEPDAGTIIFEGTEVRIGSPRTAIALGIGMVHQHFMLISRFTVGENIVLGSEPSRRWGGLDLRRAEREIQQLSQSYRIVVDLRARIETLSVGMQQRVEILKTLYRRAELLILDEPTPVLTPQEVEEFFTTIRRLKTQGKTVILITHKLNEVMTISDRVTVMRHGKVAGELETASTSAREIARMMVGDDVGQPVQKAPRDSGERVVDVEHVTALNDRLLPAVRDVSFTINKGEILGVAAVEGNGQAELVQAITGLRRFAAGRVAIKSRGATGRPSPRTLAHIPEDRIKFGIVLGFTVLENLILGRHGEREFSRLLLLRWEKIDEYAERVIDEFDIRPRRKDLPVRSLSGGNQQKVVVGRELSKDAAFIVASQPTRGLDIRAIDFVHSALIKERNRGKAILLLSSDLAELLELADRIAVMYEGRLNGIFHASETNERELGLYMTGFQKQHGLETAQG